MQHFMDTVVAGKLSAAIEDYLALNTTKLDLATVVRSYTVRHAMNQLLSGGRDFVALCQDATQVTQLQQAALGYAYSHLYSLTLPVMKREMLDNMNYISYLQRNGSNATNVIMTSLYDDPLNTTLEVINKMYTVDFIDNVDKLREELEIKLNDLADAEGDLEDDIALYADKTRMDYTFFTLVLSTSFYDVDMLSNYNILHFCASKSHVSIEF